MLVAKAITNKKQEVDNTIALLREAAWNSLFVFTKTILGYDLLEENPHRPRIM